MRKVRITISKTQLSAFKRHAVEFATHLIALDPSLKLRGRKRVDCLAKACGYSDFGQVRIRAKGIKDKSELVLFSPKMIHLIAGEMATELQLEKSLVLAAAVKASETLYTKPDHRWTFADIGRPGFDVVSSSVPVPPVLARSQVSRVINSSNGAIRRPEGVIATALEEIKKALDWPENLVEKQLGILRETPPKRPIEPVSQLKRQLEQACIRVPDFNPSLRVIQEMQNKNQAMLLNLPDMSRYLKGKLDIEQTDEITGLLRKAGLPL